MKIPGKDEVGEFGNQMMIGFAEGAAVGLPVALGLRYLLDRRTGFRNAGSFPRTLMLVAPPVFAGATWMEVRSRQFEADRRNRMKQGMTSGGAKSDKSVLETGISSWIADNKYKCIIAGWAGVLGGSFWYVNKDPYLSRSQKIVQARVWAQGATVIMLVASVILSVSSSQSKQQQLKDEAASSWKVHMKKD